MQRRRVGAGLRERLAGAVAEHAADALEQQRAARHAGRRRERRAQEAAAAARPAAPSAPAAARAPPGGLARAARPPGDPHGPRPRRRAPGSSSAPSRSCLRSPCLRARRCAPCACFSASSCTITVCDEQIGRRRLAADRARDQALGLGIARLVLELLQTAEKIGDQVAFLLLHDGASRPEKGTVNVVVRPAERQGPALSVAKAVRSDRAAGPPCACRHRRVRSRPSCRRRAWRVSRSSTTKDPRPTMRNESASIRHRAAGRAIRRNTLSRPRCAVSCESELW